MIYVEVSRFDALVQNLRKASNDLNEAQAIVERCKTNLDMQISVKPILETKLSSVVKTTKMTRELIDNLAQITSVAAEDFRKADKDSSAKSNSILANFTSLFQQTVTSLGLLMFGKIVIKHSNLVSLFIPADNKNTGLSGTISRIKQTISKAPEQSSTSASEQISEPVNPSFSSAATVSTSGSKVSDVVDGKIVYKNSFLNLKANDYSNFNTVKDINLDLFSKGNKPVFKQGNYSSLYIKGKEGKNQGCTATSEAFLATLLTGVYHDPTKGWTKNGGSTWPWTNKVNGTKGLPADQYLKMAAELVSKDNPVLFRITNHTVCAIGLKNGVTPDTATASDVLVMDPADGLIKTLTEACGKSRKIDSSYSLRIAKPNLK